MPLYEFACEACGHTFEKLQNRGADFPACPHCDKEGSVQRLVSSTSFQLKGSGWYVTDYKSPASAPSAAPSPPPAAEAPAKASTPASSTDD